MKGIYRLLVHIAREGDFPENTSELLDVLQTLVAASTPYYILGGGTNVIVGDGYWDGAVIITTNMSILVVCDNYLTCGTGLPSSRVAEIAFDHSKTGLEFLYLLPGSIGGALSGNARYANKNVSDVFISTLAVHPDKGMKRFRKNEIKFAYKYTNIVEESWIVSELSLAWKDGSTDSIRKKVNPII